MAKAELRVDETDFAIIRAILVGEGYWRSDRVRVDALAKGLGLHPNTVHSRIRRLEGHRYFLPPSTLVDPGPLGLFGARAFLDVPAERRDDATRSTLNGIEGLHSVFEYLDGWDISVFAEDPEGVRTRVELARRLAGASRIEWETPMRPETPLLKRQRLGSLELRVMLALLGDFGRSLPEVATELRVSTRTVERKFQDIARNGTIRAFPILEGEAAGMVTSYLRVDAAGARLTDAVWNGVLAAVPNHHARSRMNARAWFFLHAAALGELAAAEKRVGAVPGVTGTKMRFLLRIRDNPDFNAWLGRVLARRVDLLES